MATPREIRRRIRSIKNTAQITRAMEMVAAAKMRRAQERVRASRPYSERIRTMIAALSGLNEEEIGSLPLLEQREIKRAGVILITADRGLSGSFNTNVIRKAVNFIRDQEGVEVDLVTVGRRGRDFFGRTDQGYIAEFTNIGDAPSIAGLMPIIDIVVQDFIDKKTDAVYIVFTRFVNTLVQTPEVLQVLPITPDTEVAEEERVRDFIFEPDGRQLLEALLPRYVETQLYQSVLESIASQQSATMVAMRAATDNANEFVDELTLTLNKVRQAQITREVSEIAAGAAALGS